MKNIKLLLLMAFSFAVFSCSNDDDNNNNGNTTGDLKLSGKVMSPNNQFPISRATIKVLKNGEVIKQQTADATGNFVIDNLPAGPMTVELSKGKFKRELSVNLQSDYELPMSSRNLVIFPKMAVVTGDYDEIEEVLVAMGVVDSLTQAPAFD